MWTNPEKGNPASSVLLQLAADHYQSSDGFKMQREFGKTPNGNPVAGRWVLRAPNSQWVDFSADRSELLENNGLTFSNSVATK